MHIDLGVVYYRMFDIHHLINVVLSI
ncbi:hypothetical protein RTM1035_05858 [Roseovarius sp. TM1035]|nr:hypothetical protein RTM1035_05858 [Roseovarius sp. TM1035]